ncbi:MAG: chromate transporter [Clostridia bacterium]|nr:chromate transporter [Clostridia bacterium]
MLYMLLFAEFFKTGLFAVGGGLATLPFLKEISVNHPEWFSLSELSNMIAVGNATPGPIGINMATYAGYTTGGIRGGLIATFAIVLPCFCISLIISKILDKFKNSIYVKGTFEGLRPAVIALILTALLDLAGIAFILPKYQSILSCIKLKEIIFFCLLFIFTRIHKKDHTILYIIIGAAVGIIFRF